MVSTKLVDGRGSQGWNGWSLYLVEVHHNRMAPFIGLDRLWRRFERIDTIPHIRSLGSVAVVGDTIVIGVGGSSVSAFSYDVRTKELSRTPTPDWLNTAVVTPPPAFSTDGRYIAYLSLEAGGTRLTVRSWPDGRVVSHSAPIQFRQLGKEHGGSIMWRNPEELHAWVPVSDSGPSLAILAGRVRNGEIEDVKWQIVPDYRPDIGQPPPVAVRPDTAIPAATDTVSEDRWTRAARGITRLSPTAFPELPQAFRTELEQLGCMIPQSEYSGGRGNVIHGSFGATGQDDWAVLCSRGGTSVILLSWGGPTQCPRELRPAEDKHFLQGLGGGRIGFSRGIRPTQTYHVYPGDDTAAVDRDVQLEHDGIDDAFEGKASTVMFCRNGKWISFSGAD